MKKTLFFCLISALVGIFASSCDTVKQTTAQTVEKPIISLMVWDGKSKEGSNAAELQLFQVGTPLSDLTIKFAISGTAKNGYDFRIRDNLKMRNPQASLIIKPVDDLLPEGDETVTITLIPDSAYTVDPENGSATVLIQDDELPDVQFLYPCSSGSESSPGSIEVTLSRAVSENVTCAFAIFKITKGNVAQAVMVANNRGRDTDCTAASAGGLAGALTGTTTIPKEWVDQLEEGMKNTPYSNSYMTNRATAQGLYRAFQNKLGRMMDELKVAEKQYGTELPAEVTKKKNYLNLMHEIGAI